MISEYLLSERAKEIVVKAIRRPGLVTDDERNILRSYDITFWGVSGPGLQLDEVYITGHRRIAKSTDGGKTIKWY